MQNIFKYIDFAVATMNKSVAVTGIALGVLLAFVNVVLRYAFGISLTWAGELTNYLFIWSALFGAAYGFKTGIHISVTIFLHGLPPVVAKAILILSHVISSIYLGLSAYFGYQLVVELANDGFMSIDLGIPEWIPHLVLPIAFAGAAFRSVEKVYEVSVTDAENVLTSSEAELIRDSIKKG